METVTDEAIVKRLVEGEAGRKIASDLIREHTADRISLKADIETLRRERGAKKRELADETEAAHKRMVAARAALTTAETEHQTAAAAQAQATVSYDGWLRKLNARLIATAPPAIGEFISWLEDQEITCRETGIVENAQKTDKINTHTNQAVRRYFSNAASLRDKLAAIRKARAEAQGLKALILDTDDIEARLKKLRESLPVVSMQYSHTK